MRELTTFNNALNAKLFSDFLIQQGIENRLDDDDPNELTLWIYHDDYMEKAKQLLQEFSLNPNDLRYQEAKGATEEFEKQIEKEIKIAKKQQQDVRTLWSEQSQMNPWPPTTTFCVIVSVFVALISKLGTDPTYIHFLRITEIQGQEGAYYYSLVFPEVFSGQIWRLVTPIFLHFSFLHIFFNCWWMKDLGSLIENRHSSLYLASQIIVIGAISNIAQFYVGGPGFGGLSGVIYGLLGFLWIRGRFDPYYGLKLNPQIVAFMGIWFVICLLGLMGPVANMAHGMGALVGMVWGYLSSGHLKKQLS